MSHKEKKSKSRIKELRQEHKKCYDEFCEVDKCYDMRTMLSACENCNWKSYESKTSKLYVWLKVNWTSRFFKILGLRQWKWKKLKTAKWCTKLIISSSELCRVDACEVFTSNSGSLRCDR